MHFLYSFVFVVFVSLPSFALCQNDQNGIPQGILDEASKYQNDTSIKGSFKLVPNGDGTYKRVPFDMPDLSTEHGRAVAAAMERKKERDLNRVANLVLTRLDANTIDNLSNIEMSRQQIKELKLVFESFQNKSKEAKPDELNTIATNHVKTLRDILLTEQLLSLSDVRVGHVGIFKYVQTPKIASVLELSERQKKQIIDQCRRANEKIENDIKEYEGLMRVRQQELEKILGNILNEDQGKKLNKLVGVRLDEIFKRSDFYHMRLLTRNSEDKK